MPAKYCDVRKKCLQVLLSMREAFSKAENELGIKASIRVFASNSSFSPGNKEKFPSQFTRSGNISSE